MRFIMHIVLPVERFNEALRNGNAAKTLARILEETRPEAAYFTSNDGKRGGYLVVDIASASEIPRLAEPWFLNFNATVEFLPVMSPQDLQQADLDSIRKKWA
jgi:hypothetical protein